MTIQPKYHFKPIVDCFGILGPDAKTEIGCVVLPEGPYHICDADGETIADVRSLNDAIPVLRAHYEKHARWKATNYGTYKFTEFGCLDVVRDDQSEGYLAYRNDDPLIHDGKPAIFRNIEEAQRAADTHLSDGLSDAEPVDDGLSWRAPAPN